MKKERYTASLFVRILCTVIIGIICLVTVLCTINIKKSKETFVENFAESQSKIFDQIDFEFYSFYGDVAGVLGSISTSEAFGSYVTDKYDNPIEEREDILAIRNLIRDSEFSDHVEWNLSVVGMTGKTYIYNSSDKMTMPAGEILDMPISQKVLDNPKALFSQYEERGFTDTMKNEPVILFAKALREAGSGTVKGIAFITMKEADFQSMYSYFASNTSDILIFNQDGELLSANDSAYFEQKKQHKAGSILAQMEKENTKFLTKSEQGEVKSYQSQKLQNTSYQILGILKPKEAFEEQYQVAEVVGVTVFITFLVAVIIFLFLKAQTHPLYSLARTMEKAGEGNLKVYAKEEGTREVRQLSRTYNQMMLDLDRYMNEMYRIEEEKRSAEIHALQMQINPHYMYNTLAGIKWLAWQGDASKTTAVIDAFIALLRNTISNMDEFITVEQEIENLKNYVLINQVRYGDNISVEYFVMPDCEKCSLPKLILQPFVENAFFHAFPEGRQGRIQIFVKRIKGYVQFEVTDNGVGMNRDKLLSVQKKEEHKGEHFTGIGINNVDDRIKMIYGMDYGINIISEEEKGTSVTILLPVKEDGQEEKRE